MVIKHQVNQIHFEVMSFEKKRVDLHISKAVNDIKVMIIYSKNNAHICRF